MESRQRVALALDHKEPDRAAVDYWATAAGTATAAPRRRAMPLDRTCLQHRQRRSRPFSDFGSAAILGALLTCLIWKARPETEAAPEMSHPSPASCS